MNHIAPLHEPLIREVPLSRLALAPENVRKTPADPIAEAEMKASIATHGLLENLVVRMDGPADAGTWAVVAGGRRLAALKALAEEGVVDADHPVPCLVAADPDMAGELSLAENIVRIAMHPADQVVAFSKLADAGLSVGSIAARFGTSERLVEQRLRLGNVAPDLLDAYRADELDLEVLKAFSVTADHERQMAAWEQIAGQGYRPSAWQVKRLLTEERVSGTSAVAKFVGVEDYEAAGGKVLRDLFSREDDSAVWFDDPALLNNLAMEKLRAFKDELATRWKWAMSMVEVDWNTTARYGRIHPEPAERTPEEQAEIEKLEARQGVLAELDDDDWTEETVREAETIETRLDEIEGGIEARAVYRREDFGIAGCIATIGRDGALLVIDGLVAPEDMPKETPAGPDGAATGADNADGHAADAGSDAGRIAGPAMSEPTNLPKDREAEARKEAGVGIGLADDLRSIRTALVKAKLAGDFEAAFDLMLFQLGRSVFTNGHRSHALDVAIRLDAGDLLLHLFAEAGKPVVAEDVEARHHIDQAADVLDHRIPEHQRLAFAVFLQTLRDPLDGLAETPVEVADGIVQAFLDLVLDVALDPVGVVTGELGHEMVGVRHRCDAVADAELALQRLLRGIVLDAEELAEIEPGLVDVVLVVLDEAGALAHHALPEAVEQCHVMLVVGDREHPAALVVPGQGLFVVTRTGLAHGRGERGEGGLRQEALVVAAGAGGGLVMDGDMVARLAVVLPARPGADAQADQHGVVGEVHGVVLPKSRATGCGRRPSG